MSNNRFSHPDQQTETPSDNPNRRALSPRIQRSRDTTPLFNVAPIPQQLPDFTLPRWEDYANRYANPLHGFQTPQQSRNTAVPDAPRRPIFYNMSLPPGIGTFQPPHTIPHPPTTKIEEVTSSIPSSPFTPTEPYTPDPRLPRRPEFAPGPSEKAKGKRPERDTTSRTHRSSDQHTAHHNSPPRTFAPPDTSNPPSVRSRHSNSNRSETFFNQNFNAWRNEIPSFSNHEYTPWTERNRPPTLSNRSMSSAFAPHRTEADSNPPWGYPTSPVLSELNISSNPSNTQDEPNQGDGGPPDDGDDDDDGHPGGGPPGPPGGGGGGPPGGGGGPPGGGGGPPGGAPPDPNDPFQNMNPADYLRLMGLGMYNINQFLANLGAFQQPAPAPAPVPAPVVVPEGNGRSNLKEPDTFSGTDPSKLRPFLTQVYLHFAERPHKFDTDNKKIIFIISYLRDLALESFQSDILRENGENIPYWDGNFELFIQELQYQFGPYDKRADAEGAIESLRMKETDRIAKYIIKFSQLANQTQWDDRALFHAFYRGLPKRIKDVLVMMNYQESLIGLRQASQAVDNRYWQRVEEEKRENRINPPKPPAPKPSTPSSSSNSGNQASSNKSSSKPKQSTSGNSAPKSKLNVELTKEGHISTTERERRMKNNLCMYCGGGGHVAKDCRKRLNPGGSTGRAAKTSETTTPKTDDTKNSTTTPASSSSKANDTSDSKK